MSEDVTQCVLVMPITKLDNASYAEAYEFFKKFLGEPKEVEEWKGEIEYFEYDQDIRPVYSSCSKSWGLGYYFYDDYSNGGFEKVLSLQQLLDKSEELKLKLDEVGINCDPEDAVLCSFTYYNGVDNPIDWKKCIYEE